MRIQQVLRKLKVHSAIHWIDLYPLGRVIIIGVPNTYLLDI